MELSIADYLIEVQFCIPFLCEEVNSWTEYFTVMVEVQICTPIQYVEVYNSCKEWFTHDWGIILKIVPREKIQFCYWNFRVITEVQFCTYCYLLVIGSLQLQYKICHCNSWGSFYSDQCLEVYNSLNISHNGEILFENCKLPDTGRGTILYPVVFEKVCNSFK